MQVLKNIIGALIIWVFILLFLFVSICAGIYYSQTANVELPTVTVVSEYVQFKDIPVELTKRVKEHYNLNAVVGRQLLTANPVKYRGIEFAIGTTTFAVWVYLNLTEEQKIEYFINHEDFGICCRGISYVTDKCFGKSVKQLNNSDVELMLKILKRPTKYFKECPTGWMPTFNSSN